MSTDRYTSIRGGTGTWRNWSEPATKGDVLRIAVFARLLAIRVAGLSATASVEDRAKLFDEYREADDDLMRVIDEIGGWEKQGE